MSNSTIDIAAVDKSVAVLSERVDGVRDTGRAIEKKLDLALATFATKEEVESKQKVVDKRLEKLETIVGWVGKTIIGAVLIAVISLVIVKGKGG